MALVLDILRHGEAEPASREGDRQRRLSSGGRQAVASLGERLRRDGWTPDRAFASPLLRAQETARLLLDGCSPAVAIETLSALQPDAEPGEVLDALARAGILRGHILLVGHQPLLGRLVGLLTGVEKGLSPATLVRVECPHGADQAAGRVALRLSPGDVPGT